jgi:coenzyme F420-reducing hydrogenase alpha subunit
VTDDSQPGPDRVIETGPLARVEGEGALLVRVRAGRVDEVRLRIFEPPRFFEAFLRGRAFTEVSDITARICGICPAAYQLTAVQAMEGICGVSVTGPCADLRRLFYCGEWLESHALHVFLLHLPDFLGVASGVELARDQPRLVRRALELKKAGNTVMELIGGRAVHPVNVRVGGWYRVPRRAELARLVGPLERARDIAAEAARFAAGLDFPDYTRDTVTVALAEPGRYPIERGRVVSSEGLDSAADDYDRHFVEEQVPWSNALHSRLAAGGSYLVGPAARFALNSGWLTPAARAVAAEVGLVAPETNPFRSILVRCVEMVHAADEALAIIDAYEEPDAPAVGVVPRAGVGHGVTEAPRGLLYHRYEIDGDGTILDAKIVPPTSQNQRVIEEDLRGVVERFLDAPEPELAARCEQTVRNYDPCISCATHFLTLHVENVP